jgi:phosphate acetyltransferase
MKGFLENLRSRISVGDLRTIVLPESSDERIIQAALILAKEKILKPVFVSSGASSVSDQGISVIEIDENRAEDLKNLLLEIRASKKGTKDELTSARAEELAHDPLVYGMYLLRLGEVDGLVAGAVRTSSDVIRTALWLIGAAPGVKTVSSSFYMIAPGRNDEEQHIFNFSDCAVVPEPTAEQLADIAISSADARSLVVGDTPRIAFLSYSTKGSGGRSDSIAKVQKAVALIKEMRPELVVEGEIQADAALIQSVAARKDPNAVIQGNANILIFPSLDAGNIGYKLVSVFSPETQALGPILQGFKKPVSDLSRGATVSDIVNVATIVASQVRNTDIR